MIIDKIHYLAEGTFLLVAIPTLFKQTLQFGVFWCDVSSSSFVASQFLKIRKQQFLKIILSPGLGPIIVIIIS